MKFLNCFCGYAGSCHDARVLRNSDLWNYGLEVCNGNHIIADGAYPLRRWLMTPYRDNGHLSQEQKHFNYMLSANRVVIERAFGLLKGRFRRLHHLDVLSIQTAVKIIMCTCILHNICLSMTIWNHQKLINRKYLNCLFRKMRQRALLSATYFAEDSVDIRYMYHTQDNHTFIC